VAWAVVLAAAVDSAAVDSAAVDSEAVDSEAVDSEAVDSAVDSEAAVEYSSRLPIAALSVWTLSLAGCANLAHMSLPARFYQKAEPQVVQTYAQLEDPRGKQLAISRETAALAEERGLDNDAISAYLKVRKLDPAAVGVAHRLAVLYDRSGMTDAASREYQAALKESPQNSDVHCDYGYFLYSTGHNAEAEAALKESLRLSPEHRQATINLALVIGNQGRYEESLQLFTKAIGPAAAMHNVGMLKLRAGETTAAKQMLAEASRRDPSIRQSPKLREWVEKPVTDGGRFTKVVAGHEDSERDSVGRTSLANPSPDQRENVFVAPSAECR